MPAFFKLTFVSTCRIHAFPASVGITPASRLPIPSRALLRGYHICLTASHTLTCSTPWVSRLPSEPSYPRLPSSVGTTTVFRTLIPSLAFFRGYHACLSASHTLTCSTPWVPRLPSGLPYPRALKKHSPSQGCAFTYSRYLFSSQL